MVCTFSKILNKLHNLMATKIMDELCRLFQDTIIILSVVVNEKVYLKSVYGDFSKLLLLIANLNRIAKSTKNQVNRN